MSAAFDLFIGIDYSGARTPTAEVLMPPREEQRVIAAFLDRETAGIDALLAKKERLIELLQEERMALITQAVTKGIDPKAAMKDSGVEWLGRIPAHWETRRIRHVVKRIEQGWSPDCENREERVWGEDDPDGHELSFAKPLLR